jgi:hypothetical protein
MTDESLLADLEARISIRLDRIEAAIAALDGRPAPLHTFPWTVLNASHSHSVGDTAYNIAKDDH